MTENFFLLLFFSSFIHLGDRLPGSIAFLAPSVSKYFCTSCFPCIGFQFHFEVRRIGKQAMCFQLWTLKRKLRWGTQPNSYLSRTRIVFLSDRGPMLLLTSTFVPMYVKNVFPVTFTFTTRTLLMLAFAILDQGPTVPDALKIPLDDSDHVSYFQCFCNYVVLKQRLVLFPWPSSVARRNYLISWNSWAPFFLLPRGVYFWRLAKQYWGNTSSWSQVVSVSCSRAWLKLPLL